MNEFKPPYRVEYCPNDQTNYGVYSFRAIASIGQIIEGARVKSAQMPILQSKQWLIKIYDCNDQFICSRTIKQGRII